MKTLLLLLLSVCGWISVGAELVPPEKPAWFGCYDRCDVTLPGPAFNQCITACDRIAIVPFKRSVEAAAEGDRSAEKGIDCYQRCSKSGKVDNFCTWWCGLLPHKRSVEAAGGCFDACLDDGWSYEECGEFCPNFKKRSAQDQGLPKNHCYGPCMALPYHDEKCFEDCYFLLHGVPWNGGVKRSVEAAAEGDCIQDCRIKGGSWNACLKQCKVTKRSAEEVDHCECPHPIHKICIPCKGKRSDEEVKRSTEESDDSAYRACRLRCSLPNKTLCDKHCEPLKPKRSAEEQPLTWTIRQGDCFKNCRKEGGDWHGCIGQCGGKKKRSAEELKNLH